MVPGKDGFLESVKKRTADMSACCPGFEVFALTEKSFLDALVELESLSFSGSDFHVMNEVGRKLQTRVDERSVWALAYIDLWFCSNFHKRYWRELVRLDHGNIRYAIQAAIYVFWSSGADGSASLGELIRECDCAAEASAVQSFLERPVWRDWLSGALPT